jgi:hypothetical protein
MAHSGQPRQQHTHMQAGCIQAAPFIAWLPQHKRCHCLMHQAPHRAPDSLSQAQLGTTNNAAPSHVAGAPQKHRPGPACSLQPVVGQATKGRRGLAPQPRTQYLASYAYKPCEAPHTSQSLLQQPLVPRVPP